MAGYNFGLKPSHFWDMEGTERRLAERGVEGKGVVKDKDIEIIESKYDVAVASSNCNQSDSLNK